MTSTNLPWTFLGRRIKPFSFAVALASFVIMVGALVLQNLAGSTFDNLSPVGCFTGVLSAASFGLLMFGWWGRSNRAMEFGLLASTGTFATLASYVFLETGLLSVSGWVSVAWAVASGGSYLLEVTAGGEDE